MDRTTALEARREESIGKQVLLQGWVRTRRDSKGGFSFIELNDGSSFGNVQVIADGSPPNYQSEGPPLHVRATGRVGHGEAAPASSPLQKKGHTFEFLRTIAHLRPRSNTFGAVARVRNCVCRSIHDFFQEQGFLYVHPPIITASDCEGAGQMFRVSTLDPANPPRKEGAIDYSQDFFGKPAY